MIERSSAVFQSLGQRPIVGPFVWLRGFETSGLNPTTTSTWPEFKPNDSYTSPKVAMQTIVYATAQGCQAYEERGREMLGKDLQCINN